MSAYIVLIWVEWQTPFSHLLLFSAQYRPTLTFTPLEVVPLKPKLAQFDPTLAHIERYIDSLGLNRRLNLRQS